MSKNTPREEWKEAAPRLTEAQKSEVQKITRHVFSQFLKTPINRDTFLWVHERMENELAEKMLETLGMVAGLEWTCRLADHVVGMMNREGVKTGGVIEGVMPTPEFVESEIFDYVQVFNPVLVLLQFDDYDRFMKSTESSVQDAERRRDRGDAYFTDRDRQINYRPKNESLDIDEENLPADG